MDNKVEKCIFSDYKDGVRDYKLLNLVTRKILYSQDVVLMEVKSTSRNEEESKEKRLEKMEFDLKNEGSDSLEIESSESDDEVELQTPTSRRYDNVRMPIERYSPLDFYSTFVLVVINDEPSFAKEVVNSKESKL